MSWYIKLPTLKVSSPSNFFKSPELINSSGDHIYKKVVMNQVRHTFKLLVQKFGRLRSQIRHLRRPLGSSLAKLCHMVFVTEVFCLHVHVQVYASLYKKIQLSFVVFHGTSRLLKSIA